MLSSAAGVSQPRGTDMFFERVFAGMLMALSLGLFGFVLTAVLTGEFLPASHEGLARAFAVVIYGGVGAAFGIVVGAVLAGVVCARHLLRAILGSFALAAFAIVLLLLVLLV